MQHPEYNRVDPTTEAEQFLRMVINTVAANPKAVDILKESIGYTATTFTLRAQSVDARILTGVSAKILQGMQALVKAIGTRNGRTFRVTLGADKPGESTTPKTFPREEFQGFIERVLAAGYGEFSVALSEMGEKTLVEVILSANETEDSVTWLGERIKPLVKMIGHRFGRTIEMTVIRDQMLYEQTQANLAA